MDLGIMVLFSTIAFAGLAADIKEVLLIWLQVHAAEDPKSRQQLQCQMASEVRRTKSPINVRRREEAEPSVAPFVPSRSTPQKAPVLPQLEKVEDDVILRSLKDNRERLVTCFDIFEILYQNSVPQRCLEHNNFLTLYCEEEKKMLCVNCIYGNTLHRMHTVTPIKNVFERVIEDNKTMEKRLQQAIQVIKDTERAAIDYHAEGKESLTRVLKQLDDEYERLVALMNEKYTQSRTAIMHQFNEAQLKNDLLLQQIAWIKTTYIEREKSLPRSTEEASVIYAHLMLASLLEEQPIRPSLVRPLNFEELRSEHIGQFVRIREIIEGGKVRQKRGLF